MAKTDGGSKFMRTMRDRAQLAFDHESEQRQRAVDDMKFAFVSGHQWDAHLTKKRRNRPCYEFNRIRQMIRRVTGQQLQNKPQIKVRPAEDNDMDMAEVYNGLIKNIEVQSHAEVAYDTAFQWACGGGYGALRVITEYESDYSFNQCLKIKAIYDPMTVYFDPSAREFDRSDAQFCFVTETISREEFKRRWPDKQAVDFDSPEVTTARDWWMKDEVRIAEYWYKEKQPETIYLLTDGTVVKAVEFDPIADEAAQGFPDPMTGQPTAEPLTIKESREVDCDKVCMVLVSGKEELEDKTVWPGKMIPIVPQWGDIITIGGRQIFSGMTRFGRDSQMVHNFELSTGVEILAKLPNSPLQATPKMIEGLESYYERMGYDDPPVLLYNADANAPGGAPIRQPMAQFPAAFAQMSALATDEMKATMNVYDASIGAQSNESSGRAILARQNQGETANFVYIDNQVKALKRLGEILVDAIPNVYDAERSIRILGEDGAEKFVKVNRPVRDQQTGQIHTINDLSAGKYDVTVTVGKSFDTARLEIAEAAQALAQSPGPFGILGQHLLIQSLDVPGFDEYRKATRKVLVNQGLLEPGDNDQPPPPPQPNPKDVATARKDNAQAQKYEAEAVAQDMENQANAFVMGADMATVAPPQFPPMGNPAPAGMPGQSI